MSLLSSPPQNHHHRPWSRHHRHPGIWAGLSFEACIDSINLSLVFGYQTLLLKARELSAGHLYVSQYVKLALISISLGFYVLKGHVDDSHHHVD